MTDPSQADSTDPRVGGSAPDAVRKAERFLELVEQIAAANISRLPEMTERYFRRMVHREAEHQLIWEEYLRQVAAGRQVETPEK